MATVKITRTNEYINGMREYLLFIDGRQVGTIACGQAKDFSVTPGNHTIVARIDWCSSPEFEITINESDTRVLSVGGLRSWRWMLPLGTIFILLALLLNNVPHYITTTLVLIPLIYILYYLTLGRKNFLTIYELQKRGYKPSE